jgi:hypothetical protein
MATTLPIASEEEPEYKWRKTNVTDVIIPINLFIAGVRAGVFKDGYGECVVEDNVSNIRIYPQDLSRPSQTTHVCWHAANDEPSTLSAWLAIIDKLLIERDRLIDFYRPAFGATVIARSGHYDIASVMKEEREHVLTREGLASLEEAKIK